jgi:DNA primase
MNNSFNLSAEAIAKAKAVSIVSLLRSEGCEPVKQSASELVYRSPLRIESTPSFYVNPARNCFKDFGNDEHRGDSITLAALLWQTDFKSTVERLLNFDGTLPASFSFSGFIERGNLKPGIEILSAKPITKPALEQYVSNRAISPKLAQSYLQEVTYLITGRQYYAVGFKNDSGGYELRNGLGFKGKTGNGITTIDKGTKAISIFEGFFDFLSALRYFEKDQPSLTTIILNTTNNLKQVFSHIGRHSVVNCFLDNDVAGLRSVEKIKEHSSLVRNHSQLLYPNHKDFNEFLTDSFNKNL